MDLFLPPFLRRMLAPLRDSPLFDPVQFVFRVSFLFYKELRDDKAFIRAAGMAYATLIALVPMLVLVFGVLGAVGVLQDPTEQEAVYDALFGTFFGDVAEIRDFLLPILTHVDFKALGAASTLALLVVAARLFLMVEQAYSDIFEVEIDRWLTGRILNFYFAITAVPLVVVVSLEAAWRLGFDAWQSPLVSALQFSLLLLALKFFPCTYVRWRPALLGAFTSWILLEVGGRAFSFYIQFSYADPDYPLRAFYGSLILIPIFLVWLYTLWLTVLLGVEVAHVAQNYSSLVEAEQQAAERERRRLRTPSLDNALEVLAHIAHGWKEGRGPTSYDALLEAVDLPPRDVREVATVLEEAGLLVASETGWLLARPPEHTTLTEVGRAWRGMTLLQGGHTAIADEIEAGISLRGTLAEAVQRWIADSASEEEPPDDEPVVTH